MSVSNKYAPIHGANANPINSANDWVYRFEAVCKKYGRVPQPRHSQLMVGTPPGGSIPGGNMPSIMCMSGNPSRLGGRWRAAAGGWGSPPPPPLLGGPAGRGAIGGACIRYGCPGWPPAWPKTSCGVDISVRRSQTRWGQVLQKSQKSWTSANFN